MSMNKIEVIVKGKEILEDVILFEVTKKSQKDKSLYGQVQVWKMTSKRIEKGNNSQGQKPVLQEYKIETAWMYHQSNKQEIYKYQYKNDILYKKLPGLVYEEYFGKNAIKEKLKKSKCNAHNSELPTNTSNKKIKYQKLIISYMINQIFY